jgi:hypothetical protein
MELGYETLEGEPQTLPGGVYRAVFVRGELRIERALGEELHGG